MTDPVAELMARLRAEYLAEMPERLAAIEAAAARAVAGEEGAATALGRLLHQLAGSAGAYGFTRATALCREAEAVLAARPAPGSPELRGLAGLADRIRAALEEGPTV